MKKVMMLMCMLFLIGGNASGVQDVPRGGQGSQVKQNGTGESTRQGGPRLGPPPEAFKACEGKTTGSTAQFAGPDGETVTGTCRIADGRLVLRPDRPPGENYRDGRRGPPPEAYKACEGKSAGSSAQFTNPRGESVKGICEEEEGKMVLRPHVHKGGK